MGALVTKAIRPIKSFNIENRAQRVISKEKPTPAPKYPSNIEDIKRVNEADPDIDNKLERKDSNHDERLRNVYVTSYGRPEDDLTREIVKSSPDRPLPLDRLMPEQFEMGFKEPDKVNYGRTTLRHAIDFISAHQANPSDATPAKIALEYKMKLSDVEDILKYFKTFEIYIPATRKSAAVFAGPGNIKKQMENNKLNEIETNKKNSEVQVFDNSLHKKVNNKS